MTLRCKTVSSHFEWIPNSIPPSISLRRNRLNRSALKNSMIALPRSGQNAGKETLRKTKTTLAHGVHFQSYFSLCRRLLRHLKLISMIWTCGNKVPHTLKAEPRREFVVLLLLSSNPLVIRVCKTLRTYCKGSVKAGRIG